MEETSIIKSKENNVNNNQNDNQNVVVIFGPPAGPKYRVGKLIGRGSYGEVRIGKNVETQEFVAIKLEKRNVRDPQLMVEWTLFQVLGCAHQDRVLGFPHVFYYGPLEIGRTSYNGLVMELLCLDLEAIYDSVCQRSFSLKTVIMIVLQMLTRIEYVHGKNLCYIDIKPENFVVGNEGTPKENIIHLLDFGLTKSYIDARTKRHIAYREQVYPSGTLRYMSVNAHCAREQSRRDDMEALGYLFAYFMRGKLPWSGIKVKDEDDRFAKVGEMKKKITAESLCKGMPEEFAHYLKTVRRMRFEEAPNYKGLRKPFEDLLAKKGLQNDGIFDWTGKLSEYQKTSIQSMSRA